MLTMTSSRHYQQLHKLSYYDIILIEKDSLYNYYCYIILKLLACHSNFMNCNWHAYMVQDSGVHKWLSILMCTQSLLSILVCMHGSTLSCAWLSIFLSIHGLAYQCAHRTQHAIMHAWRSIFVCTHGFEDWCAQMDQPAGAVSRLANQLANVENCKTAKILALQ